jgi:hypothetical protein
MIFNTSMAGEPLARFRKVVNKSIEQRRQMIARFREAVEQSVTLHKRKERFRRPSQSRKRSGDSNILSPRRSQFRRMSTRIEIASLGGGSVGSYFDDISDIIDEDDLEVRI